MNVTTIGVIVHVGAAVYRIEEVGDPNDALFATQVGRTVSQVLIAHRETPVDNSVENPPA